jgi:hypothetical protein
LPEWRAFIQALPQDNKRLAAGYLENLERTLTPNEKERLLKGNWEYDDDPACLMQYEKIIEVFQNVHVPGGKKRITGDLARLGGDKIVKVEWDGWRGHISYWTKTKLNDTATRFEAARTRMGIDTRDVIVDDDGLGGGVVDFCGYIGFVNNAKPYLPKVVQRDPRTGQIITENYDNAKSQCYYKLADRVNKNGLYLTCEDAVIQDWVIEEFEQVKQKALDSDMKKGVVPKDIVKELLGRSPDFSDAIMQAEAFELMPTRDWVAF